MLRTWLIGGLAAIATLSSAGAGAQTPAAPLYVTRPNWVSVPTGDDVARVYPAPLKRADAGGFTSMTCHIDAGGRLNPCMVTAEAPTNVGVGDAGLMLAEKFRMGPADGGDLPVVDRLITIPIVFRVAEGSSPPRPYRVTGRTVMIDPSRGGSAPKIACPTAENANRQCYMRELSLQTSATAQDLAGLAATIGKADGVSRTACEVGPERALINCTAPDKFAPEQLKAFNAYVALMKASEKTDDGKLASGTVVSDFDWGQINQALKPMVEAEIKLAPGRR